MTIRKSRAPFGPLLCFLLVLPSLLSGQTGSARGSGAGGPKPSFEIRPGRPIRVDGLLSPGEWADADSVLVETWSPDPTVVRLKHDGEALLFAFSGVDPARPLVPEVLIAVAGLDDSSWTSDHWWFHASGQDCWAAGSFNRWDTCTPEAPTWEASNPPQERDPGTPLVWEVRIPFETLGPPEEAEPLIGLAFDLTDTSRYWFFWPGGARLADPFTWARAEIKEVTLPLETR